MFKQSLSQLCIEKTLMDRKNCKRGDKHRDYLLVAFSRSCCSHLFRFIRRCSVFTVITWQCAEDQIPEPRAPCYQKQYGVQLLSKMSIINVSRGQMKTKLIKSSKWSHRYIILFRLAWIYQERNTTMLGGAYSYPL